MPSAFAMHLSSLYRGAPCRNRARRTLRLQDKAMGHAQCAPAGVRHLKSEGSQDRERYDMILT